MGRAGRTSLTTSVNRHRPESPPRLLPDATAGGGPHPSRRGWCRLPKLSLQNLMPAARTWPHPHLPTRPLWPSLPDKKAGAPWTAARPLLSVALAGHSVADFTATPRSLAHVSISEPARYSYTHEAPRGLREAEEGEGDSRRRLREPSPDLALAPAGAPGPVLQSGTRRRAAGVPAPAPRIWVTASHTLRPGTCAPPPRPSGTALLPGLGPRLRNVRSPQRRLLCGLRHLLTVT